MSTTVLPTEKPAAVDFAEIKRKSVRGGLVTFGTQGVSIAIQLTSTIVLARLLSPDDYGTMAMVMAITAFAGLFRDLGLSAAAIQKGELSHGQMTNLFWLNVAMGALLTALLAAASPLVAWFYGKPELVPLTVLLSTSFLIGSLGTQHGALLVRSMQFGKKAIASIAGSLVTLMISIGLAWYGHGYWALAWGGIAGGLVTTAALFVVSPFRPGLWSRGAGIGSMLRFGANVTAFDFVNYFHRNLDSLLIGRVWGTVELGLYSRAYSLLMFPITAIRGPIGTVAFPALSRLQGEPASYRAYYRQAVGIVSLLSMPLCVFLFLNSREFIALTIGDAWIASADMFSALAIAGVVQPSASLRGTVVMSLGLGRRYVMLGVLQAAITSIGFAVGVQWGGLGVAVSYPISVYGVMPLMFYLAFRNTPVSFWDYLGASVGPFVASLAAGMAAFFCGMLLVPGGGPLPVLVFQGGIFAVFYVMALLCTRIGRQVLSRIIAAARCRVLQCV